MCGFDDAMILSPSVQSLCQDRLAQWPPICVQSMMKNALQITSLAAYARESNKQVNAIGSFSCSDYVMCVNGDVWTWFYFH